MYCIHQTQFGLTSVNAIDDYSDDFIIITEKKKAKNLSGFSKFKTLTIKAL